MKNINLKEHYYFSCIYLLKFPNNKNYIGCTCNLYRRVRAYWISYNRKNLYKNEMQVVLAIKEFKFENVKLEILEELFVNSDKVEREKFYIKLYDSTNINKGYNRSEGGAGSLGCKILNRQNIKSRKKIRCIETAEVFESIKEANNKTHISNGNIVSCCKGNRNNAGGFTWEYI